MSGKDNVRVVVGSVPVPATVVDDSVFVFLQNPGNKTDVRASRGAKIAQDDPPTADAYHELICNYLHHVRSAREYIEAVLHHAVLCMTSLNLDTPLSEDHLPSCLVALGLNEWAEAVPDGPSITAEIRKLRANDILLRFLEMYASQMKHFKDLRRDLL